MKAFVYFSHENISYRLMLLKDRKWLKTGGEMSFVNQNQFPCILLFLGELKDQLLSMGEGGGRGREYLRIIWCLGRAEWGLERLYSGLWFLVKCVSPHFISFLCFRNDPNEQILLS